MNGNIFSKMSKVNLFILITFSISWTIALLFYLLFPNIDKVPFTIMAAGYMFVPTLSVLIVDLLIDKKKSLKSLAINLNPNWWYMAAWPGIILLVLFSTIISVLWPTITFSPDMTGYIERMSSQLQPDQLEMMKAQFQHSPNEIILKTLLMALAAGISINAIAGLGEEIGWRGLMVREYKGLNFWSASLRIGFIWGLWHSPLILMGHNYPQHPVFGVGMMIVWCILITPLFMFVRIKTHSVIGAAIMHGTMNACAAMPLLLISGGTDLTAGFTGFTGMISIAIAIGIMVLFDLKFSKHSITNKTILDGIKQV